VLAEKVLAEHERKYRK
jgi:hypothetical protein